MAVAEAQKRTFRIRFEEQVNDGLVKSDDLIAFLRSKMKVKNSKALASRVIELVDKTTELELVTEKENMLKKNLKQYLKRYLRSKDLRNFIKLEGDSKDEIKLVYVNKIEDDE